MENDYFKKIYDEGWVVYVKNETLPNGQMIRIEFEEYQNVEKHNNPVYYNICLELKNKRKNKNIRNKQTGTCGLDGLLWAKKQVIKFEEYIINKHKNPIILTCTWDDNKRRRVYDYGLKKIGFYYSFICNRKVLIKKLK